MKDKKNPVGRPKADKPAGKRFDMRITDDQHQAWSDAAIRDGYEKGGKANISGWLKDLADKNS